jgi:phage terminase small subunit
VARSIWWIWSCADQGEAGDPVDANGTQAAIRAGYSEKGAEVHAHRLLRNPGILDKIRAVQNRALQCTEVSVERVLREYAYVAFFDPAKLYDSDGNLLPIQQMPDDARRAIAGMEIEELFDVDRGSKTRVGTLRKVRFAGKLAALDALAKHLGLLRGVPAADGERKLSIEEMRTILELWEERARVSAAESIEVPSVPVAIEVYHR